MFFRSSDYASKHTLINNTQNWLPQVSENFAVIGRKCEMGVANDPKTISCLFFLNKGASGGNPWACPGSSAGAWGGVPCRIHQEEAQTPEPSHLEDYFWSPLLQPIGEGRNIRPTAAPPSS